MKTSFKRKTDWKNVGLLVAITVIAVVSLWVAILGGRRYAEITTQTTPEIHATGTVSIAMITVPVPIQDEMEGHDVVYRVVCHLEDGVLNCQEANKEI